MTTAQTSQVVVAMDPVLVNTRYGAVAVFGHEHVSKKDLLVLSACLEEGSELRNHNVKIVVFRTDDYPKKNNGNKKSVLANCSPDVGGVCINLMKTFSVAVEDAIDNPEISVVASYQRNMILNYLHEIHHLSTFPLGPPEDPKEFKEEEEAATTWSIEKMFDIAKKYDIEPAHHSESPFLAQQLMELLTKNNTAEDDSWSKQQLHMLNNRVFYALPPSDKHMELTLTTFKSFMHFLSKDDVDNKNWEKNTGGGKSLSQIVKETPVQERVEISHPVENCSNTVVGIDDEYLDLPEESLIASVNGESIENYMKQQGVVPSAAPVTQYAQRPQDIAPIQQQQVYQPAPVQQFVPAQQPAPVQQFVPVQQLVQQPVQQVYQPNPVQQVYQPAPAQQPAQQPIYTPAQQPVQQPVDADMDKLTEIVVGIYFKAYNHIFNNCGQTRDSDIAFNTPEAVYTNPITLTPEEANVLAGYDAPTVDDQGAVSGGVTFTQMTGGYILGYTTKNVNIPAYKLYIKTPAGITERILLPQNPAKTDNSGKLSRPAVLARGGEKRMYIIEGNNAVANETGKKFLYKIVDGKFQS